MKLSAFVMLFIFLCTGTISAQPWQWAIRGGSTNTISAGSARYNNVKDIATDQAGNVYMICKTGAASTQVDGVPLVAYSDIGTGNTLDILLCSFTPEGNFRWAKVIGGTSSDFGHSLKLDSLGHVYVAGTVWPTVPNPNNVAVHFDTDTIIPESADWNKYKQKMFLIQYDTAGTFQWLRMPEADTIGIFNWNSASYQMDVTADGKAYWFCKLEKGALLGTPHEISSKGAYILQYDHQGQVLQTVSLDISPGKTIDFSGSDNYENFLYDQLRERFYIGGYHNGKSPLLIGGDSITSSMYLAAFDSTGQVVWKLGNTGSGVGTIDDMAVNDSGDIFITGSALSGISFGGHTFQPEGREGPYLMKLHSSGNMLWSTIGNTPNYAPTNAITLNKDEVTIAGYATKLWWPGFGDTTAFSPNQGYDAFLARFTQDSGKVIDMARGKTNFGGASFGHALAAGPEKTYYLGGNFDMQLYLGPDSLYKIGSERSFFLTKYQCAVPEASFSYLGTNSTNTLHLAYSGAPADSIQWLLGDGTQAWGDTIHHSYSAKGNYRVCATAYFDCTDITVCDSLAAGSIGLSENLEMPVAVYPNPSTGIVKVNGLKKGDQLEVCNLAGKRLLTLEASTGIEELDLTPLPDGVYVLRFTGKGRSAAIRLVKRNQ